jgi:hypothetical protein
MTTTDQQTKANQKNYDLFLDAINQPTPEKVIVAINDFRQQLEKEPSANLVKQYIYANAIKSDIFEVGDSNKTKKLIALFVSSRSEPENMAQIATSIAQATSTKDRIKAVSHLQDTALTQIILEMTSSLQAPSKQLKNSVLQEARGFLLALVDNNAQATIEILELTDTSPEKLIEIFNKYATNHPFAITKSKPPALVASCAGAGAYDSFILSDTGKYVPVLATADTKLMIEGDSLLRHALSGTVLQLVADKNPTFTTTPATFQYDDLTDSGKDLHAQLQHFSMLKDDHFNTIITQTNPPIDYDHLLSILHQIGPNSLPDDDHTQDLLNLINTAPRPLLPSTSISTQVKEDSEGFDKINTDSLIKLLGLSATDSDTQATKINTVAKYLNKNPNKSLKIISDISHSKPVDLSSSDTVVNQALLNYIETHKCKSVFVGATSATKHDLPGHILPTNLITESILAQQFGHLAAVYDAASNFSDTTFTQGVNPQSLARALFSSDHQMLIIPSSTNQQTILDAVDSVDVDFITKASPKIGEILQKALESNPNIANQKMTDSHQIALIQLIEYHLIDLKSNPRLQEDPNLLSEYIAFANLAVDSDLLNQKKKDQLSFETPLLQLLQNTLSH